MPQIGLNCSSNGVADWGEKGRVPARWHLCVLLLLLGVTLVYIPVFNYDFINFDDQGYVYDNPVVKRGLSVENVGWAFKSTEMCYWHPLTWVSHMLDISLFGLWAGGHHLTSLLLHLLNTVLLIALIVRMTGQRWPAVVVGALFALHPTRVETVVWVTARKDLLSTTFLLLALLAYSRWLESGLSRDRFALVIAFAAGLMAKPILVTFPFVLLLVDRWPLRRYGTFQEADQRGDTRRCRWISVLKSWVPPFHLWREKLPLWLLSAAFCAITWHMHGAAVVPVQNVPLSSRLANAISGYGQYLWQLLWPVNLGFYYQLYLDRPVWQPLLAGATLLIITAFLLAWQKFGPYAVGWFVFLGTLVPVIGFVQIGEATAADRFNYVPYVGLFGIVVGSCTLWLRSLGNRPLRRCALAVALSVLVIFGMLSFRQVSFWRNSNTVFAHSVELDPANAEAWFHLGDDYCARSEYSLAIQCYKMGLKTRPEDPKALQNMASTYLFDGQTDAAIATYRRVLGLHPGYGLARRNLSIALAARAASPPPPQPPAATPPGNSAGGRAVGSR